MRLGTMVTSLLTLPASKLFHQMAELKWFSLCRADTWFCEALLCILASRVMSGKQNKIKQKNIPLLRSEPDWTGYRRQSVVQSPLYEWDTAEQFPLFLQPGGAGGQAGILASLQQHIPWTNHHFLPCAFTHSFSWSHEQLCPLRTNALCTWNNLFHIPLHAWSVSEN